MVKVLVNGGLFEISKVEEIVEKRVPFNGTNIRLVQIAKDSKQAVSGLHFQVKNTECNVFAIGEFTIGNLPTAKVKEIMSSYYLMVIMISLIVISSRGCLMKSISLMKVMSKPYF